MFSIGIPTLALSKSGIRVEVDYFLSACKTSSPNMKFDKSITQDTRFVNFKRRHLLVLHTEIIWDCRKVPFLRQSYYIGLRTSYVPA